MNDRPPLIRRLFNRLIIVVGLVGALWLGIQLAANQQSTKPQSASNSSAFHGSDPAADPRTTVRR